MLRLMLLCVLAAGFVLAPAVMAQDQEKPAKEKPAVTNDSQEVEGSRLSRADKRRLGILPRQVLFRYRELVKDGEITPDMSTEDQVFVFLAERRTNPEYEGAWDDFIDRLPDIIDFLSKLFELIARFFL